MLCPLSATSPNSPFIVEIIIERHVHTLDSRVWTSTLGTLQDNIYSNVAFMLTINKNSIPLPEQKNLTRCPKGNSLVAAGISCQLQNDSQRKEESLRRKTAER